MRAGARASERFHCERIDFLLPSLFQRVYPCDSEGQARQSEIPGWGGYVRRVRPVRRIDRRARRAIRHAGDLGPQACS